MKKKIYLTAIIIVCICMSAFTLIQKDNDRTKVNALFQNNTISININNTNVDDINFFNILKKLSIKYDVNIYKNFYTSNNSLTKITAIYLTYNQHSNYQLNGQDITVESMDQEVYISTVESNDERQVGVIKDLFADNEMTVCTFEYFLKNYKLNNSVNLQFRDINKANKFIEDLQSELTIERENILINLINTNSSSSLSQILNCIVLITLLSFCIVVFYYTCENAKRIAIMKLNGFDKSYIFYQIIMPIYKVVLISSLLCFAFIILLVKNINAQFVLMMLANLFKMYGAFILISFISYCILTRFTLSEIIKGSYGKKIIEKLNYILKLGILIGCFIFSGILISNISRAQEFKKVISSWIEYQDYAIVTNIKSSNPMNLLDSRNNDDLRKIHEILFKENYYYVFNTIIENQNLMFNGQNIMDIKVNEHFSIEEFNPDIHFNLSMVNINYLNTLNLKDINGNDIVISEDTYEQIFLIPKSKHETQNYEYILKFYTYIGLQDSKDLSNTPKINYIIYDDSTSNKFFSFNVDQNEDGKYNVLSPIFNVVTSNNILNANLANICATDMYSPLKIPLKNQSIEVVNEYLKNVFEENLKKASYTIEVGNLSQPFLDQIGRINYTLIFYTPVLFIILIIYILLIVQSTKLYVKNNLKSIAVKKLNGFTLVQALRGYLVKIAIIDIFASITYLISVYNYLTPTMMDQFHNIMGSPFVYLLFIPMILFDLFFIVLNIKRIEKKSLNNMLKGDYYANH